MFLPHPPLPRFLSCVFLISTTFHPGYCSCLSPCLASTLHLEWHKGRVVFMDFPGGSVVKNSPANAGDVSLIPGPGRSSGGGNGNPLQCSCLENPRDWGAWWAAVSGVAQSRTWLKRLSSSSSSSIGLCTHQILRKCLLIMCCREMSRPLSLKLE